MDQQFSPSNDNGMSIWAIVVIALCLLTFCGCGTSFILAPLGIPFMFLTSVAGIIVAKIELGHIERGESPAGGKMVAQIGFFYCIASAIVSVLIGIGSAALIGLHFSQQ